MKTRALFLMTLLGLAAVVACSDDENASTFPEPVVADAGDAPRAPEGEVCCAMACGSGFETTFTTTADDATLQTSTISVCRNDQCFETSFADMKLPTDGPGTGRSKPFLDPVERDRQKAPLVEVTVWDETPWRLAVRYSPWASTDWNDGDRYAVLFKDARGTELHRAEAAVSYVRSAGCCQEICGHATFDEPDGGADAGDAGDGG